MSRRRLLYAPAFFVCPLIGGAVFFIPPDGQVITAYVLFFLVPVLIAVAASVALSRGVLHAVTAAVCAVIGSGILAVVAISWLAGHTE